jgi:hypothetical protein
LNVIARSKGYIRPCGSYFIVVMTVEELGSI